LHRGPYYSAGAADVGGALRLAL